MWLALFLLLFAIFQTVMLMHIAPTIAKKQDREKFFQRKNYSVVEFTTFLSALS